MVVCKFFLQGNCRFGDNCKNEHPRSGGTTFGNNNRFGALQGTGNRFGGNSTNSQKSREWNIDNAQLEIVKVELGAERPKWVLTTYSVVKNTPGSLFEGNEYSPEEIRQRFYEMAAKGQEAQADQEASQLWSKAESDFNSALNRVGDIRKFMDDCETKHPNRYDFLKFDGTKSRDEFVKSVESTQNGPASSAFGAGTGFGQNAATAANPFSKPAAATFGQPSGPSAFGGTAFGKPAQSAAFGQGGFGSQPAANAFGQTPASNAFSKPAFGASGFGQSAFGQPAQTNQQTPAFGTTTGFGASAPAFGQATQPTSAFGQPSQPTSAFGQAARPAFGQTAFGQTATPGSAVGMNGTTSAFGQPSKPGGFGQSAFGQPAQPAATSAFGTVAGSSAGFGTAASTGFGGASTTTAFGSNAQLVANPFGARQPTASAPEVSMDSETPTSVLPAQNAASNPFTAAQPSSNPFGGAATTAIAAPATTINTQPPQNVRPAVTASAVPSTSQTPHPLTGKPPAALAYAQTLPAGPTQTNLSKQLSTYRGQAVRYLNDTSLVNPEGTTIPCFNRPDGKGAEKIWFPDGHQAPEIVSLNREDKISDVQGSNDKYTEDVTNAFKTLFETGMFEAGKMPSIPPKREWIAYDF